MKKIIIKIMTFLTLVCLFALPIFAEEKEKLPRLVDQADLLTDKEEDALEAELDETSKRQECDVIIVTVNSLEGKTAEAYADDFYDENGYGFGENADGILLLISMEERKWAISTCGYGITAFTDAGQEYMVDRFKPDLSDEDYEGAFMTFARLCDDFLSEARNGEPYDKRHMPKGKVANIWILGDLVIGFVIALGWGFYKKSELKSIVRKASADDYTKKDGMQLTVREDHMVNRIVTKRRIEKDSSDGGSSTHTSSSGETHGGSSGSF